LRYSRSFDVRFEDDTSEFWKSCVGVGGEAAEIPSETKLPPRSEKYSSISMGFDENLGATEACHIAFNKPLRAAWTSVWLPRVSFTFTTFGVVSKI
jgi:hypothetical protein